MRPRTGSAGRCRPSTARPPAVPARRHGVRQRRDDDAGGVVFAATFSAAAVSFFVRDHSRTNRVPELHTPGFGWLFVVRDLSGRPDRAPGRAPARQRNRADENEAAELEGAEGWRRQRRRVVFVVGPTSAGASNTKPRQHASCVSFFSNLPQAAPDGLCDPRNTHASVAAPAPVRVRAYRAKVFMCGTARAAVRVRVRAARADGFLFFGVTHLLPARAAWSRAATCGLARFFVFPGCSRPRRTQQRRAHLRHGGPDELIGPAPSRRRRRRRRPVGGPPASSSVAGVRFFLPYPPRAQHAPNSSAATSP